jgi:hypothetical protein
MLAYRYKKDGLRRKVIKKGLKSRVKMEVMKEGSINLQQPSL